MSRQILIRLTLLLGALAIGSDARAQTLDLKAEQVEIVSYPGATAAFALDAAVATVTIAGDRITIVGRAPGSTHVMIIAGDRTHSIHLVVGEPPPTRAAATAMQSDGSAVVAGTLETRYVSSPEIVQTTARMFQQRGERSRELMIGGTQPLYDSPATRFNIPIASYRIRNKTDELTFFDRTVDNSPLTVSRVNVRGLHIRRGPWMMHSGYSFFSTFENLMLPAVREGIAGAGYRVVRSPGRVVTPNVYYLHRGDSTGPGGLLGTVAYESRWGEGGTLLTEAGVSRSVAAAADLEVRRTSQHLWARVRFVPASYPSLSVGQISGRAADVVWSQTRGKLALGATVSAHRTATATPNTTSLANFRMDYRPARRWTLGAQPGYSLFNAAGVPDSRIQRVGMPVYLGLSAGFIETLGDYELSHRTGSGRFAHSVQGTVNANWKALQLSARADRQMDTPTVGQIMVEAPWLQPLLNQIATSAVTSAQLAELIRTTDVLTQLGYSTKVELNVAPVVTHRAFGASWSAAGRMRPRVSLSTVLTRQELITSTVKHTMHTLTYSQSLGSLGDIFLTSSLVCSRRSPLRPPCESVMAVSLSQNLPSVISGLVGRGDSTIIQGTVFRDDAARGYYAAGMPTVANIEVVLDGERRTRTDSSGHFLFKGVRPGAHRVEAPFKSDAPYFFTTPNPVVVRDNAVVNIGVGLSMSRLLGSVTNDTGSAIGDAVIQIVGANTERTTRTSGDGTFSMPGLQPGTYEVRVEPASVPATYVVQDLKPQTVTVDPLKPGRVDFKVRAFRSVLGVVRFYDACVGAYVPVAEVAVTLQPLGIVSTTDQAGRYVFRDLPAGSQTLSALHAGSSATVPVTLPAGGGLLKDVNLSLASTDAGSATCSARAGSPSR